MSETPYSGSWADDVPFEREKARAITTNDERFTVAGEIVHD